MTDHFEADRIPAEDPTEEMQALETQIQTLPSQDEIAAALDSTRVFLEGLYNAASAAGDETAMTAVTQEWERAQAAVVRNQRTERIARGFEALAKTYRSRNQQSARELQELTDAVKTTDYHNPLVRNMAETLIDEVHAESGESMPYDVAANWGWTIPHYLADDLITAVLFADPENDDISPEACGYTAEGLIEFRSKVLIALGELLRTGNPDDHNQLDKSLQAEQVAAELKAHYEGVETL